MAARRGKSQARRNTGSGGGLPGWAWMVLGVLLTLLAVLFVPRMLESDGDGFFRPTPNPDAQPAPAAVDELPAPARRPAGESDEGGGEEPRRGSQYDFYTVLPGREVPMTDAELAATQREEAERLARQQQEAAAAANSEDAAELALPAPVATDSPSTPAAEPQPAPAPAATATPPTTGAGIGDGSRYILQAGAFQASGQAEELKARIALLGLTARVESARINDRTVYRVRMGPYGTAGDLAEAKQKLANGGLDAMAIKVE